MSGTRLEIRVAKNLLYELAKITFSEPRPQFLSGKQQTGTSADLEPEGDEFP